ncbi:Imm44 family immunity protein [uncultured Desulfobacter sp.]|uniref:Imm44 family immunity protein n=1 Tax=uncultured Desulfobacter sp. TaxID=240139 RepID=UPI002AA83E89|nr:Imm44 family immunity protein [uncultured Desulfobacter sp.]
MDFGISKEISADITQDKINMLTDISLAMEEYFKDKDYGADISSLTIGIICVAPEFEFFFNEIRRKYTKTKKMLEYDIKLDHSEFKNFDKKQIQLMVAKEILASLSVINELKIKNFEINNFKTDLRQFFKERINIDLTI